MSFPNNIKHLFVFLLLTLYGLNLNAESASLHFKMENKSTSSEYKSKLANLLLLEDTSFLEGYFNPLQIRGTYNVLLYGLNANKSRAIETFISEYFDPLKCGRIVKSSIEEDMEEISEFDDLCVFPGSKLIFVNLENQLPDSIEIRDLED